MADDMRQELDAILAECWDLLARGARDPDSRLHAPVLATTRADGAPDARTILIESVESESRRIRFNTDARSPKLRELNATPQAVLVFFDGTTQIRARTHITVHRGNAAARRSWDSLPERQRIHYRSPLPPGTPTRRDGTIGQQTGNADEGWDNYALVEARVTCLDWLRLDEGAGRRAAFTWSEDGHVRSQWVVP